MPVGQRETVEPLQTPIALLLRSCGSVILGWNCEESVRHILHVRVLPYNRASSIDTFRMRTHRGGKIDGRVSVVSSQELLKVETEAIFTPQIC